MRGRAGTTDSVTGPQTLFDGVVSLWAPWWGSCCRRMGVCAPRSTCSAKLPESSRSRPSRACVVIAIRSGDFRSACFQDHRRDVPLKGHQFGPDAGMRPGEGFQGRGPDSGGPPGGQGKDESRHRILVHDDRVRPEQSHLRMQALCQPGARGPASPLRPLPYRSEEESGRWVWRMGKAGFGQEDRDVQRLQQLSRRPTEEDGSQAGLEWVVHRQEVGVDLLQTAAMRSPILRFHRNRVGTLGKVIGAPQVSPRPAVQAGTARSPP